jgi:hypothetical protein
MTNSIDTQNMRKNWLYEQLLESKKQYDSWPQWMKDAFERHKTTSEPTYPNHYDSQGYCDNPARGY